jgi:hypothetical protein
MANFIVYNDISGEILRNGTCPNSMIAIQANESNESAMERLTEYPDDLFYIDIPSLIVRSKADFPIIIDSLSKPIDEVFQITNIPLNTFYEIHHAESENVEGQATESTLELALESEGQCRIRFTHLHYKDLEITLNAY